MNYVQGEFEVPGEPALPVVICALDGCDRPRSARNLGNLLGYAVKYGGYEVKKRANV